MVELPRAVSAGSTEEAHYLKRFPIENLHLLVAAV